MFNTRFDSIAKAAEYLKLDINAQEMALLAVDKKFTEENLETIEAFVTYLKEKKHETTVSTLLRLSRLPLKEPKTFENFNFSIFKGKELGHLKELEVLAQLYARKNMAFIGPQGVGKTHLAMAFGRRCCELGLKTYFLKATELNQKLLDARKYEHVSTTVNGLVKPACLIIDEVGRCVFDKENTRLFFDIIDKRYSKEGPNTIIFTSNIGADHWNEFFEEESSLLCALDRIFDSAEVYMIKGKSYRGRKRITIGLTTGDAPEVTNSKNQN